MNGEKHVKWKNGGFCPICAVTDFNRIHMPFEECKKDLHTGEKSMWGNYDFKGNEWRAKIACPNIASLCMTTSIVQQQYSLLRQGLV